MAERFVTVLTPVYLNVPERIRYLEITLESFYRCNFFPGKIVHYILDDRSPMGGEELESISKQYKLRQLKRMEPTTRRSFSDVYQTLLDVVETEFVIYLEPDHYFFQPADFISPAVELHRLLPELHQVYFRAPLVYERFRRQGSDALITHDGTTLRRVKIDEQNTGWVGSGRMHETFSLMPSLFRTEHLRKELGGQYVEGGPADFEVHFANLWEGRKLVGYLNGQAFCYHIGAAGKEGPGGYLTVGDARYEEIWSKRDI